VEFDLSHNASHPLVRLPADDLDLIVRLVLHSGSLKDLAATYKVSYPTIRARLDRVIDRLQTLLDGRQPDPLTDLLASLVEQGEMTPTAARRIKTLADRSKNHHPTEATP
jgi:hypothetical protein